MLVQNASGHQRDYGKRANRVLRDGGKQRVDQALEELQIDPVDRSQTGEQTVSKSELRNPQQLRQKTINHN